MKPAVITLLLALFTNTILAQLQDFYPPTVLPDRIMLNLTEHPSSSMAVTWRAAVFVKEGYVEVAETDPSPGFMRNARLIKATKRAYLSDKSGANYFSATMDSLKAETLYAYRVGDNKHWSEWSHFKTAAGSKGPLSFIYFGDAQNDIKSMWSRAIRSAYQQMPKADFLLHAGDLINRKNSDHEWGEWYYAGGWIYRTMPSIATPGNHEYGWDENGLYSLSKQWKPTFTLPENGPKSLKETAYFIDYQGLRIISLDSPAFLSSEKDSADQVKWLKEVLENNKQRWTIITMHHPMFSTKFGRDNENLRSGLQSLFEAFQVDLVLQGHDHTYGRGTNIPIGLERRGTTIDVPIYVVSVSGPKMYDLGLDEWMHRGASNTQLYQLIHIDGNELKFEAYTVDNKLYDAFQLKKKKSGKNIFYDLTPVEVRERLELPPRYEKNFTKEEIEKYRARFEAYKARKQPGN